MQLEPASSSRESLISMESESVAQERLRTDMEPFLSRHFMQQYFDLLLNPDSHNDFYDDWINDIKRLMQNSKSLQYSVLANAASHMHWIDKSPQMQELALGYYSRSIKGLSETLAGTIRTQDQNATLMSVMLLYLHGVSHEARISVKRDFD